MYFRSITLTNFRSHKATTLDLKPLTFIRSPNGAGKSSVEMAIEITMAGRCEGTSSDGKGAAGLIRGGTDKASISLAAVSKDGEGNLSERIIECAIRDGKRTTIVTKADDPKWTGGKEWEDWLESHRNVLSCLINNRRFVEADEDVQKKVLAGIILPKQYEWREGIQKACHDLGLKINWAKAPFEVIEEAYKAAYDARRDINRDIKNFTMPNGDTSGADKYQGTVDKLAKRKKDLQEAVEKRGKLVGSVAAAASQKVTVAAAKDAAEKRIAGEQEEITRLQDDVLSKDALKKKQAEAKNAAKAKALDDEAVSLGIESANKKKLIEDLSKLGDTCPTCKSTLTEEVMSKLSAPLIEERATIGEAQRKALTDRKALGNPAEAQAAIDAHTRAEEAIKRCNDRIQRDNTLLRDAKEKLKELNAESPAEADTSAIDAEIAKLTEDVAQGEAALAKYRDANKLAGEIESAKARLAILQTASKHVEEVVAYFDADGVKAELLAASIGSFTDKMNESLAKWGFTCQLSIEPYVFAIQFIRDDKTPTFVPLKMLNRSLRFRFALAFQVALAVLSGFRFVVVDEAEIYDKAGKNGLFKALTTGELEQVIIMGTDENEAVHPIKDAVFIRLDNVAGADMLPTTKARVLTA